MSETKILKIKGHDVLVDAEFAPLISIFTWQIVKRDHRLYAEAPVTMAGKRLTLSMHRLVTKMSALMVDHKNGNGLDNRQSNLRLCTNSQNQHNARKRKNSKSKFKGVNQLSHNGKWQARIKHKGVEYYLGQFETDVEAAKAYDEGSRKYHGEFGRRNFD